MATRTDPNKRDKSPLPGTSRITRTLTRQTRQTENRSLTNPDDPPIEEEFADTVEEQVQTDTEGPIRDTAFPVYKLLRKQHMRLTTAKHHVDFLTRLRGNHQVPKGLKPRTTTTTTSIYVFDHHIYNHVFR